MIKICFFKPTTSYLVLEGLLVAEVFPELFMKVGIGHRQLLQFHLGHFIMERPHPQGFVWRRPIVGFKLHHHCQVTTHKFTQDLKRWIQRQQDEYAWFCRKTEEVNKWGILRYESFKQLSTTNSSLFFLSNSSVYTADYNNLYFIFSVIFSITDLCIHITWPMTCKHT